MVTLPKHGTVFRPEQRLHLKEPDYTQTLLVVPPEKRAAIVDRLALLYGPERAEACYPELERLLRVHCAHKPTEMAGADAQADPAERFSEKDVILITYGDAIRSPGKRPLRALSDFVRVFFGGLVNTVHILPFFPYSSDRGFSIIDYEVVDSRLGSWEELERLSLDFKLMFDGVVNHVSSKSRWFIRFLDGNPIYQDFFITFSTQEGIGDDHLKLILRPRATPVLTRFQTINGPKMVWTTFSPDQVDLNYKNERVLLRVIEILLFYVRHGADIIRLDAITYLWHELGTTCAHLQQTHVVVQLMRSILDVVAPRVALLTETNVPHEDNISYFGNGQNEAQMVYNFALPPLVLLSFHQGNCRRLAEWAATLETPSDTTTYLNFLDSHDGVGLLPVKNIAHDEERELLVQKALEHGGLVSYRDAGDGSKSPYELNITWFNALNKEDSDEPLDLQVDRFIASRAVNLVLRGVPGLYLVSLLGGHNDQEGVRNTGEARSINRGVIEEREIIERVGDQTTSFHKIMKKYFRLLEVRTQTRAFHPNGAQRVVHSNDAVFSVLRTSPDATQTVLALINVTALDQTVEFHPDVTGLGAGAWEDLLSQTRFPTAERTLRLELPPYRVYWLVPVGT